VAQGPDAGEIRGLALSVLFTSRNRLTPRRTPPPDARASGAARPAPEGRGEATDSGLNRLKVSPPVLEMSRGAVLRLACFTLGLRVIPQD
jgi:hypothetical protein